MKREVNPRLAGKKEKIKSSRNDVRLSSPEMESLTSIFETLVPSVDHLPLNNKSISTETETAALKAFYQASGSQRSIPDEAAEIIRKRGLPEAKILVRAVLWLLSTRIGTLLLCGSICFGKQWPFVKKFAHLPAHKREKILQGWSSYKYFFFLRLVFYFFKSLCLYLFLSLVDEKSSNPAWEAMGYRVDTSDHLRKIYKHRPLEQGLVETINETPSTLSQSLAKKGLIVTEDPNNNHYTVECDVVIIGSGSGGAVAASILSAAGQKVVVLEKGNYYTALDYSSLEGPSMDEMLEDGGMLPSTDGTFMLLAGKVVGGGSAVNWSASIKTPKHVLEDWNNVNKLRLYGSLDYSFAMDAVCERLRVTDKCAKEGFQNQVLRRGCEKLGLEAYSVPRNSSENHSCGSCQYGCRSGDKQGTDLTWLVDCVGCGGVIISGCQAERLILAENGNGKSNHRKRRCVGVVAKSLNGSITRRIQIKAKVTISACGALFTPPLLISSGLKNRHIGRNLHLHPASMVWGYFPESPDSEFEGNIYEGGLITSAHEVKISDEEENCWHTTTIANSNKSSNRNKVRALVETPAMGPGSYGAMCPWESGVSMKERLLQYSRRANFFTMIRDQGSGEVLKEGRISYKMTKEDKENIEAGLRRSLRILVAAGATEVGTYRSDGPRIRCQGISKEELEKFLDSVRAVEGPLQSRFWSIYCTAHQMGSCRMGVTQEEGAVDENGESWEAEGLFVCDGSVLPGAVGVNPMITIQSTAYCISKRLAERLKKGEYCYSE